jgi:acetyl/propionyl-CoA carboxylase alpha subunit
VVVKIDALVGGRTRQVELRREGAGYRARIGDRPVQAEVLERGSGSLLVRWGERTYDVTYSLEGGRWLLDLGSRQVVVEILDPLRAGEGSPADAGRSAGRQEIRAAMPGKVVAVKVVAGQAVAAGQALVVVEAMKMENEVPSPRGGTVAAVAVAPGQTVEAGALLAVVE